MTRKERKIRKKLKKIEQIKDEIAYRSNKLREILVDLELEEVTESVHNFEEDFDTGLSYIKDSLDSLLFSLYRSFCDFK